MSRRESERCQDAGGSTYVPGWSAKVGLGGVVVTLTVAAEEEHLVLDVLARLRVQLLNLVVEALPLSEVLALVLEHLVGRVSAVDEAKVDSSLYTKVNGTVTSLKLSLRYSLLVRSLT